jgi:hypothetical protein
MAMLNLVTGSFGDKADSLGWYFEQKMQDAVSRGVDLLRVLSLAVRTCCRQRFCNQEHMLRRIACLSRTSLAS